MKGSGYAVIILSAVLGLSVVIPAVTYAEGNDQESVTILEGDPGALPAFSAGNSGTIDFHAIPGQQAQTQVPDKESGTAVPSQEKDEKNLHGRQLDTRDPAKLREIKEAGRARVMADLAKRRTASDKAGAPWKQRGTMPLDSPGLAQKTQLLPLVIPPAADCESSRQGDIGRLTAERETADNALERDRKGLDLAAAHVGAGELDEAQAIYEDLAQHAAHDGIRQTARENLKRIGNKTAANNASVPAK